MEHFADGHKHKVKGKKKTKKGTERNKVTPKRSNYHKVTQQLSQDVEAALQQQPQLQLSLRKMLKALLSTCVLILLVSAFALHLSRDGMLLTDKDHPEGIVAARTQSQLPVNNSFTAPAPAPAPLLSPPAAIFLLPTPPQPSLPSPYPSPSLPMWPSPPAPELPPPQPPPLGVQLTSRSCSIMLGDPHRLFFSMWAPVANGWVGRGHADETCFGQGADSKSFFDRTAAGSQCNRNWLEGTHEWPSYASDAPALLGFGGASMMEFCLKSIGEQPKHLWWANSPDIANACVRAQKNILRLKSGWTMCLNLQWQVCAAKGLLPGQGETSREIHFSPAPKTLRIDGDPSPARPGGHAVPIIEADVSIFGTALNGESSHARSLSDVPRVSSVEALHAVLHVCRSSTLRSAFSIRSVETELTSSTSKKASAGNANLTWTASVS